MLTEPKMSIKVMFHMAGDVLTECVASFMTELCTVVESPILPNRPREFYWERYRKISHLRQFYVILFLLPN